MSKDGDGANDWRSGPRAARDTLSLVFGWGFVTTRSGRVFLPLIGRPKLVPSPAAERWVADSWPRWWLVLVVLLVSLGAAGGRFNGWSMPALLSMAVMIGTPIVAVLLWCWREQALTRSWNYVDDASLTWAEFVITALGNWPRFQLFTALGGIAFFAGWQAYKLATGPALPPLLLAPGFSPSDYKRWAGLILLIACYLIFARTAFWVVLSLLRKRNSSLST